VGLGEYCEADSPARSELLLDLLHQRARHAGLAQGREILDHHGVPRLVALHLGLAAVREIDRARLLGAPEQHERVGPVGVEPGLIGRELDRLVGGGERRGEAACEYEVVGEAADARGVALAITLPLRGAPVALDQATGDGGAFAIGGERLGELLQAGQHATDIA